MIFIRVIIYVLTFIVEFDEIGMIFINVMIRCYSGLIIVFLFLRRIINFIVNVFIIMILLSWYNIIFVSWRIIIVRLIIMLFFVVFFWIILLFFDVLVWFNCIFNFMFIFNEFDYMFYQLIIISIYPSS